MAEPTRTDKSRHTHTEMRHNTPDREQHTCPMFNILMANVSWGYTRGDTRTQMRSTAHHVRSNTPGNNLLFFVFSYFWVCRALETLPVMSMMIPCHLSPPFSHHHHHICLPVPHPPPMLSSCLPRTLAMADKDQENGHGPLQVSSHSVQPCIC